MPPLSVMRAMRLQETSEPLIETELDQPVPGPGQVLVNVLACAVCRTDLHIVDGELTAPRLPLTPGHQIVGRIAGDDGLVGMSWLGWACGVCAFCRSSHENLCPRAQFTGLHRDGGFATQAIADRAFCLPLADGVDPIATAPLLCAGLIGHRALRRAGDAERLGLYGFGAAAHLVCQEAVGQGRRVMALTRPGDEAGREFARSLGAAWAGPSDQPPPEPLDAAIIFAPVGSLVPEALRAVRPGGTVVCAGIHMSDIPAFAYELLWGERTVCSVANLTRADGHEFLALADRTSIRARVTAYPLAQVNGALADLRAGRIEGAAVVDCSASRH